jgi:hypothetical protein
MEYKNDRVKIILAAITILSLLSSGIFIMKNKSAKIESDKAKSVLVAEKDMLNMEIKDLITERKKLVDTTNEQSNRIKQLLTDIDKKNSEIQRLLNDNAKVKDLRNKLKELEEIKNELQKEVESQKGNIDELSKINTKLENNILALTNDNDRLNSELMFVKSVHSSDFLINGVKRNEKITAFAKRSKTIKLSFDFPANHINEIEVSVVTPEGKIYTTVNKEYIFLTPSKEKAGEYPSGISAKRMELWVKPEKKFSKGIYKITILAGTETVATMQIQLK